LRAYERTGSERQIAGSDGERGTSPAHQGRTLAPITWDEIGAIACTPGADGGHSEPRRRFVWLPPGELRPHPSLARYGIATTTAEHNRISQQDGAAFQEAVEITTTGTILDGYAQWKKALDAHCRQILCIEYSLTDEQAIEWLLRRHRRRNGWNKYCRTIVVLELENKFRQEVANHKAGGQTKGSLSNLTKGEEMHVRSKLAKLADVCEAYIDYVKQLREEAHPSILQAHERKEVTIHWAWTLLTLSKSEQREILENRRTAKAVRVAYPRPRKPKTISIDPSRMLQVWQVLAAVDASDIKCTVISIDGKKVEIRVQINEGLFTSVQSQGDLKLS
jgi:hypothetical protein